MKKQSGFSLLEVLVAMTITVILVAAALAAFSGAIRVNETVTAMADMDQNLRAGMNLMIRDLIQAGSGIPTGGIPLPNGPGAQAVNRPAPVGATFQFGANNWQSLSPISPGAGMGPQAPFVTGAGGIANGPLTDLVNILYADSSIAMNQFPTGVATNDPNQTQIADDGSSMTVDNTLPITGIVNPIRAGDLIVFQNPQGSALQTVTGVGGQTINFVQGPSDAFNLNQRANANAGTILNIRPNNPPCPVIPGTGTQNCWRVTTAQRVYLVTYYMDRTNAYLPRLMRRVNMNPAQPVAEIVENLQLSYDLIGAPPPNTDVKDPNALAVPQAYNQIRKANVFLAARSTELVSAQRRYLRNNLTTQVSLRGATFFNAYP